MMSNNSWIYQSKDMSKNKAGDSDKEVTSKSMVCEALGLDETTWGRVA